MVIDRSERVKTIFNSRDRRNGDNGAIDDNGIMGDDNNNGSMNENCGREMVPMELMMIEHKGAIDKNWWCISNRAPFEPFSQSLVDRQWIVINANDTIVDIGTIDTISFRYLFRRWYRRQIAPLAALKFPLAPMAIGYIISAVPLEPMMGISYRFDTFTPISWNFGSILNRINNKITLRCLLLTRHLVFWCKD